MKRNPIAFFMLVVLIDSIGFGIIIPVMPSLLQQVGAGDVRHAVTLGGLLTFAYAAMQFVCAPIVGALSDRFGRRPVLLASMLAFALDYALMAVVPAAWMLFIGRLIAGATGACYPTANAAIADVTPPEARAKNFGLTGMAFGVGFIIGPLAGGLIGGLGPRAPFVAAAALAALNFLYGSFLVPETLAREKRRPFSWPSATPFGAVRDIARRKEIRGVLIALFLWQLAFQALPSTWAYFTRAAFGWNSAAVGTSLAFSGVTMAVVLGAVIGPAVKRFGERRAAIGGLTMGTLAYVSYAFAPAGWVLYPGMALWALGSLVTPACNALMSARLGAGRQGELQGIVGASFSLSAIVAPIAMTQIFEHAGPPVPWLVSAALAGAAIPHHCGDESECRAGRVISHTVSKQAALAKLSTRCTGGLASNVDKHDKSHRRSKEIALPKFHPDTAAVHAGRLVAPLNAASSPPLFQASSYEFEGLQEVEAIYAGTKPGAIYGRYGGPNASQFEAAMAELEGAEAAVGAAAGMSAIHAALTIARQAGRPILASRELYGGTFALLENDYRNAGIPVEYVDQQRLSAVAAALARLKPAIFYAEALTNPLMRVADLPALAELAHTAGALFFVDATFATPVLCRPLDYGADLVIHSVGKYLGGHGDVGAGIVAGRRELVDGIRARLVRTGATMPHFEAWLALRGLRTLALRMDRHSANAVAVARYLASDTRVSAVYHPSVAPAEQERKIALLYPRGTGGIVAFELAGGAQAVEPFLRGLETIAIVHSLGEVATTISYPAVSSHRPLPREARLALGVTDATLRVSAGIEDARDIVADLARGLAGLA